MVEKVKKETRFRRSLFPSVGGYPLVLERGCPNEGASLQLFPAKPRSSPTTKLLLGWRLSVSHKHNFLHLRQGLKCQLTDARQVSRRHAYPVINGPKGNCLYAIELFPVVVVVV